MTKFIEITCEHCKGTGTIKQHVEKITKGKLRYIHKTITCPTCKGTGKTRIRV